MIKQTKKQVLMLAAIASLGVSAPSAFAQAADVVVAGQGEIPYVIDARNVVARSGAGLCWRTGYWSPAAASTALAGEFPVGCACDSDIVPADKCAAPVAAAAPAPAPKPTADKIKLSADALFDFDKAVLKPEGQARLNDLAAQAKSLKLEVILAVGHTDRIGSAAYNQRLSERRAAAVKTYLVAQGVDANRIYTEGKGKTQPVTGNQCDNVRGRAALISCLQPDRRVEVEVIGSK
ncbi:MULTISPECIES: OmpA family protein [unclassified Thauera]|uniref:OmpA family protein n=1 Tax=unclassified Thauera TaxID=2609274 RepID=UPI0022DE6716|nr:MULTISPECIES: OmpA family protein [unclassified Thauera]WBL65866.1 OmpA family protein [Thauera sp. WB-2]HRJ24052.1 OmpA family protein [Thauera sp.]HRK09681.1 OmpA family protein [Thauera sp.]